MLAAATLGGIAVVLARGLTPVSADLSRPARTLLAALVIGVVGQLLAHRSRAPVALWMVPAIRRPSASPIHEARAGGLRIMGNQASRKRTPERRRKELYELYLRRSDRINDWDLVDISAHQVVGGYLLDKPRDVLYELARSPRWWERRIAMFATPAFVRTGDLDDTFTLAGILVHDEHDLVQKVVGGVLREAGKHDRARLLGFLDSYAATAPRVLLRDAIEHLDPEQRAHYLNLKPRAAARRRSLTASLTSSLRRHA